VAFANSEGLIREGAEARVISEGFSGASRWAENVEVINNGTKEDIRKFRFEGVEGVEVGKAVEE